MEQGRFFYSTNGTTVAGPVTEDQLRQLWKDYHIGTGSFLWREGETYWTPLARDPELARVRSTKIVPSEVFAQAIKAAAVPSAAPQSTALSPGANGSSAPPVEAIPAAGPAIPALPPSEPAPDPIESAEETALDSDGLAVIINTIAGLAAVGGAALSALLAPLPPGDMDAGLSYRMGAFAGGLAVIVLVPYFIAWMMKGMTRIVVRAALIMSAALLCVAAQLGRSVVTPVSEARAMSDQQKHEAQKEIANKGYYTADAAQAERNIQKLKGQLTDDSETSRIGRDILGVTTELLGKVKASDAVEANCKFTLDGVKSADDFTARIGAISLLRTAQNEVVAFLQGYDQRCQGALTADHIAPATQSEVIAGARKGAHIDLLITLWQEKVKLSEDHIARFVYLQKNWGGWQVTNGQVIFTEDTQATGYDLLVEAIEDDVSEIRNTQKQIFQ